MTEKGDDDREGGRWQRRKMTTEKGDEGREEDGR